MVVIALGAREVGSEEQKQNDINPCLLYTSDAADERSSVDLGGRRIIQKKKKINKNTNLSLIHTQRNETDNEQ